MYAIAILKDLLHENGQRYTEQTKHAMGPNFEIHVYLSSVSALGDVTAGDFVCSHANALAHTHVAGNLSGTHETIYF